MAKAQPSVQSLLARVGGLSLSSSEAFGQALHNNTASHQKAL